MLSKPRPEKHILPGQQFAIVRIVLCEWRKQKFCVPDDISSAAFVVLLPQPTAKTDRSHSDVTFAPSCQFCHDVIHHPDHDSCSGPDGRPDADNTRLNG
jgi:hypothetical protein